VQHALAYSADKDLEGNPVTPIGLPKAYGLSDIVTETLRTRPENEEFLVWHSSHIQPGKKTLVLFPGNFGHLGTYKAYASLIKQAKNKGYQILAVNHVGFAGSPAGPSQAGFFREAEQTVNWLLGKGIEAKDMYITGISMGTTIAAHASNYLAK